MMMRPLIAVALVALAAAPTMPRERPAADAVRTAEVRDLDWRFEPSRFGQLEQEQLIFTRDGERGMINTTQAAEIMGAEAMASLASPGGAIAFTVSREPGTLDCRGTVTAIRQASGSCSFTADPDFLAAVTSRGLSPDDPDDLIGATLIDASIAQVDGLQRMGFEFGDFDDVVAVAALGVTPAFAAEMRAAGLAFDDLDDLVGAKAVGVTPAYVADMRATGLRLDDAEDIVSARAVGVDRAWLSGMAEVGYADLQAEQAIQLKAMGVTPDYARKMARVMRALEGSESE